MENYLEMKRLSALLPAIFLMIIGLSCASHKQFEKRPLITEEDDRKSIPEPKEQKINLYEDGVENTIAREINDFANLSRQIRKLGNNPKEALNVNAFDEVPNSSWFTNRHARQPMSIEELKRGPDTGTGPDMSGPFTVIGAKVEGVSPGFTVRDARGDVYFIKFDITGFPQLNTGAEVVSTKFIYAAGYNTPENYLSVLDPKRLTIEEGVTIPNQWGRKVPMTFDYLQEVLQKVNPNPDGAYRVVASKRLSGKPVGPFQYIGTRKDDPNDYIPHQKRRELRGYKSIAAWLNNNDAKANNSLDMYVTENGESYVKHHMIDFATSLGSSGYGAAGRDRGHRGGFDVGNMLKKIFSLGLWVEGWEKDPELISPSVGYFESRLFDPGDYAQLMPNPAFQRATNLDGFWAAKIIMSFTDEQIRAMVETGQYQNQKDADYIAKTLIERRDKTGRYWYRKVNPLDNFRFFRGSNGQASDHVLEFEDLAVKVGFEKETESFYRFQLQFRGKAIGDYSESFDPHFSFTAQTNRAIEQLFGKGTDDDQAVTLKIQTRRGQRGSWGKWVQVHIFYPQAGSSEAEIVGIEREG